jgi:uncharacterized protein (TIGR04255 family)
VTSSNPSFHLEFESPPVVEVVCGVMFEELNSLLAPHFGILWEKFRDDYPDVKEFPPLELLIENINISSSPMGVTLSNLPPLPRICFLRPHADRLIQVQRDRFLHNWRKVQPEDVYPHFQTVFSTFKENFFIFEAFLQENDLGIIAPLQCELVYVNAIPVSEEWTSLTEIGRIFPDFRWRSNRDRFLFEPEAINWTTSFSLPDNAGRLHIDIKSALRTDDGQSIALMQLTVRGIGKDKSREGLWEWFNLAHDWIIRGFVDLTSLDFQRNIWRRKDDINNK